MECFPCRKIQWLLILLTLCLAIEFNVRDLFSGYWCLLHVHRLINYLKTKQTMKLMVIREGGGREVLMLGQVKVSYQLEVIDFHLMCLEGSSLHKETLGNFFNEREALAFYWAFVFPWVCGTIFFSTNKDIFLNFIYIIFVLSSFPVAHFIESFYYYSFLLFCLWKKKNYLWKGIHVHQCFAVELKKKIM